MAGEISVVFY